MNLTLGFSPCPNDTFIFDALVHERIKTCGLSFAPLLADVQELNEMAVHGTLDITKLSYAAFPAVSQYYQLLPSGGALGRGCGPLLISRRSVQPDEFENLTVAIPGTMTTANLLLGHAFPTIKNRVPMLFSAIEQAVLDGAVDAGVIIHENRFTYASKGLVKLMDLGELWEQTTGHPIPLGGIAIKRSLPDDVKLTVARLVRESVEFAFANPDASAEFVRCHSQEMSPEVTRQHIELYVNLYSVDLGEDGRKSVRYLFEQGGLPVTEPLFVEG